MSPASAPRVIPDGVIDTDHLFLGYFNLMVTAASVIPTNLGQNPVMTVMAMTERAMSRILAKKE